MRCRGLSPYRIELKPSCVYLPESSSESPSKGFGGLLATRFVRADLPKINRLRVTLFLSESKLVPDPQPQSRAVQHAGLDLNEQAILVSQT